MGIIFKDSGSFRDDLTRDLTLEQRRALEVAAQNAKALILEKTSKGVDVNYRAFKAYQGGYREQIKRKGSVTHYQGRIRSERSKQLRPVNLTLTGNMLGAIQTRVIGRKGVELFLNVTESNKARGNEENGRRFFGMSDKDFDRFVEDYKNELRLFNE